MIEIEITDEMRKSAFDKSMEMGQLRNSITQGKHNEYGFLGEAMVAKYLNCATNNTYEYDIILQDGTRLEVKSKPTPHKPPDYYEANLSALNPHQRCDYYVFCRIMKDKSKGWIVGYDSREDYLKTAKLYKKGEKFSRNEYTVRSDCYIKEIKNLQHPKKLLDIDSRAKYRAHEVE